MVWYPAPQQDRLTSHMKQNQGSPFRHHLFVCHGERCAQLAPASGEAGHSLLKDTLKSNFKKRDLNGIVRVSQSGCLGQCDHAPNIMDYPSGAWYREVQAEDLSAIEEDVVRRLKSDLP